MSAPINAAQRDRLLLAAALFISFLLLLQLLDFGEGRDQGIYATIGNTIRAGRAPYRDAWDFKPPGIFFVYAIAAALSAARGVRVLEAIGFASLFVAFPWLSNRYAGNWRSGLLGATLAVLMHVQLEFWHTAQPESFGGVVVAWAIVSAVLATDSWVRPSLWWTVSGALYGIAALLKPTIGIAACASLGIGVWIARRRTDGWASALNVVLAFAFGLALPVTACVTFFVIRGGLLDMGAALLGFAPQYTALGWVRTDVRWAVTYLLRDWLFGYSLLLAPGLLLLALVPSSETFHQGIVHVSAVVLLLLLGVAAQLKFFPYHFGSVLPLTALLAGWGYWNAWERLRDRRVGVVAFVLVVGVLAVGRTATRDVAGSFWERCWLRSLAWLHPAQREAIREHLYSVADYSAPDNRIVADWIRHETPTFETLYVWGFTPELYERTGRRPASRYIYDVPQRARWSRDTARLELMRDLTVAAPFTIVVERGDVIPMVTGTMTDSATEVRDFDALRHLIASRYQLVLQTPKFDVYRRVA